MAVGELSDEALMAALRAHPELRQRVSSIVLAVEGDEGALKEADAAEERMVEETEREIRQRPQMHRLARTNHYAAPPDCTTLDRTPLASYRLSLLRSAANMMPR